MNIMPAGKEGFWRLAMLPFKAYVVAVPVVAVLSFVIAELAGWNDLGASAYAASSTLAKEACHRYLMLEYGYVVCILGLLVGAFCQREKRGRRSALIFSLLGIVLMVLLFPGTQYTKTKSASGPNPWVQATPAYAFCLFLSHRPGAPDPDRSSDTGLAPG